MSAELDPRIALRERVQSDFRSHKTSDEQEARMLKVREFAAGLGVLIVDAVPPGREQASALTNLEQAMFWANSGIARKG